MSLNLIFHLGPEEAFRELGKDIVVALGVLKTRRHKIGVHAYSIDLELGADLKSIWMLMGLNKSTQFCPYCQIPTIRCGDSIDHSEDGWWQAKYAFNSSYLQ